METKSILEAIEKSKNETNELIKSSKDEMLNALSVTNKKVEKLEKEVEELKALNATLEKTIKDNQENIKTLYKKLKSKNLVIYGLKNHSESIESLENIILDLINNKLKIPIKSSEIDNIRSLGRQSNKSKPILITFLTEKKRNEILRAKNVLFKENIYINRDYTYEERKEYKLLKPYLIDAKNKGLKASIRNGKLLINGDSYSEAELKSSNPLTNSPTFVRRKSLSTSNLYNCKSDEDEDVTNNQETRSDEGPNTKIQTPVKSVKKNPTRARQNKINHFSKNESPTPAHPTMQRFLRSKLTSGETGKEQAKN